MHIALHLIAAVVIGLIIGQALGVGMRGNRGL